MMHFWFVALYVTTSFAPLFNNEKHLSCNVMTLLSCELIADLDTAMYLI